VYVDGVLYEGTGLNGRSSLRRVDLESGKVLQRRDLAREYFGEGIAVFGKRIIQLTWQSRVGFVYDRESFALQRQFSYRTEGWGLTHDGKSLIMSDGTATLRWLDPETFAETRSVVVRDQNGPVVRLNELEYIRGEIYANIWQTDRIARIDPQTGRVTGWIDLRGLLSLEDRQSSDADVLNGIAYDAANDRLFVTGKLWPKLFEIELTEPDQNSTPTPSAARTP
jgi:glutamine cyclotransferase